MKQQHTVFKKVNRKQFLLQLDQVKSVTPLFLPAPSSEESSKARNISTRFQTKIFEDTMPGRMRAAMLVCLLMSVLLDNARAQASPSCKCVCCAGNYCDPQVVGTFSVSSSSGCDNTACRSKYPTVCPASGGSGSVVSQFIAASSVSSSSASAAETLLVTRTSLPSSPAACVQPDSCSSKCSACYTYSVSGNSATLTPGSVSGCTCYAATFGSSGVATAADGSTSTTSINGCVATVQTQVQGATCTSTYAVTKITGSSTCPSGATTCPSSTYSTSSANSAADGCSIVGMLFSVMAAALVATMSTKTLV